MMQGELENKNGVTTVIQKLTKELKKLNNKFHNDETIKNKIKTLLTEKITDLEVKTRNIIRGEIRKTKEMIKSQTTYAARHEKIDFDLSTCQTAFRNC